MSWWTSELQDDARDRLGRLVPGMEVQVSLLSQSMELDVAAAVLMAVSGGASNGRQRWLQGHIKEKGNSGRNKKPGTKFNMYNQK